MIFNETLSPGGLIDMLLFQKLGYVPVLIEQSHRLQFFYLPCDNKGYPDDRERRFIEMPSLAPLISPEGVCPSPVATSYSEIRVYPTNPVIVRGMWPDYRVLLWKGEELSKGIYTKETVNVSNLMAIVEESLKAQQHLRIHETQNLMSDLNVLNNNNF